MDFNLKQVHDVLIRDINWEGRSRTDYGDISILAKSISDFGLIHPIVLDDKNVLIVGGRRLSAMIYLEWTHAKCLYITELSPIQKKEMELEENIQRLNLNYVDEANLKKNIDDLKKSIHKDWITADTAELYNESVCSTQRDIELAKAFILHPELTTQKNKTIALSKLSKIKAAALRAITASYISDEIDGSQLIHGDATIEMLKIPDNSVDLILFDPPFGVGLTSKADCWIDKWPTIYGNVDDTEENIFPMVDKVLGECARVLKDGAHIYVFFAFNHQIYPLLGDIMAKYFKFQSQPLLWVKPSNHNYKPFSRFTVNYEGIFFGWKGKQRELTGEHNAVFSWPLDHNKEHPAQKPFGLYHELITLSSIPGEVVLDPMMGSGMSLATAISTGCRVIGIEQEKSWYDLAVININKFKKEAINE